MDIKNLPLPKRDPDLFKLINAADQKILAVWSMDCLGRGRYLFCKDYEENEIIDKALDILKLWIDGGITMWEARKYCWTVLKAAREMEKRDKAACQILRACSHTLAVCHVKTHCEGTCIYVLSAIQHRYGDKDDAQKLMDEERAWQINRLSELKGRDF
jgi:hypothetical protein